jgi:hypothetical protein
MNAQELIDEIASNLKLSGADVPYADRMVQALNRSKDELVRDMELLSENTFTAREEFEVASGDEYIERPADFRRLIGLTRTDGSRQIEVIILDPRERRNYVEPADRPILGVAAGSTLGEPLMYPEGERYYFTGTTGAPVAMTLLMRYRKRVADATVPDASVTTFAPIPDEYGGLLADMATVRLIPAGSLEFGKVLARVAFGRDQMRRAYSDQQADQVQTIRWME